MFSTWPSAMEWTWKVGTPHWELGRSLVIIFKTLQIRCGSLLLNPPVASHQTWLKSRLLNNVSKPDQL